LLNNSKAQGIPMEFVNLLFTVFLIFFAIFFIILPAMEEYYIVADFSMKHLEYDVLSARILNAPECLAYSDSLGRAHAGTIDIGKYTEKQIKDCLKDQFYIVHYDANGVASVLGKDKIDDDGNSKLINNTFLVRYTKDSGQTFETGFLEVAM